MEATGGVAGKIHVQFMYVREALISCMSKVSGSATVRVNSTFCTESQTAGPPTQVCVLTLDSSG